MQIASHRIALVLILSLTLVLAACTGMGTKGPWGYPLAKRGPVVDDYHGTQVADPYRGLEDPDSETTQAWVQAQMNITNKFLHTPARNKLKERITKLHEVERFGAAREVAGKVYFLHNDGLQNQSVLMAVDADDPKAKPVLVLDPNTFAKDGTAALSAWAISPDGKLLAYARSEGGSDQRIIKVRDLGRSQDLPETLRHCKFSYMDWKADGSGFFYNRYPDPTGKSTIAQHQHNKVFFHVPGQAQADDRLVFEHSDPDLLWMAQAGDDGRYLVLQGYRGTSPSNRVWLLDLHGEAKAVSIFDTEDARYDYIENIGATFYFQTDKDAPKTRVVAVDLHKPGTLREIIDETQDAIESVLMVNHRFVVNRMHHAKSQVSIYNLNGLRIKNIELPGLGSVAGIRGRRSGLRFIFGFESYLRPLILMRYHFEGDRVEIFRSGPTPLNVDDFVSEQIFIKSKDGTELPVFVLRPKAVPLDGKAPLLLYGYGGFNISLKPHFRMRWLPWLAQGGTLAVANLRGGGEYGEAWHQAGVLGNKQNVFDDFIAVSEGLIERKYTSKKKLAIIGGSNGGLLTAACMLQRPELFGAVVSVVPVTDMLRYTEFTVGRFWVSDYGNAKKDPAHFKFLYAYSPLHNVQSGTVYPPLLMTTAEGDDRVVPAHAYKFMAEVQQADGGEHPLLLRVEGKAGHGHGKPITKQIDEYADLYSFLFQVLDMRF